MNSVKLEKNEEIIFIHRFLLTFTFQVPAQLQGLDVVKFRRHSSHIPESTYIYLMWTAIRL